MEYLWFALATLGGALLIFLAIILIRTLRFKPRAGVAVSEETVTVVGRTLRGTARGVYHLEDEMRLTGCPILAPEACEHAPLFSPRVANFFAAFRIFLT